MTIPFNEIINRLTKDDLSSFKIGAELGPNESNIAETFVTFLENKLILFSNIRKKCPGNVIESVRNIRERTQNYLESLSRDSILFKILHIIRSSTHRFLTYATNNCENPISCKQCQISSSGCISGLLALRREVGRAIALLCAKYKLNLDDQFNVIIPSLFNNNIHSNNSVLKSNNETCGIENIILDKRSFPRFNLPNINVEINSSRGIYHGQINEISCKSFRMIMKQEIPLIANEELNIDLYNYSIKVQIKEKLMRHYNNYLIHIFVFNSLLSNDQIDNILLKSNTKHLQIKNDR